MPGLITAVTDANFAAEVLESETPVLVDFWAEWCGPCRVVAPILEEINEEQGNLRVVKLNVDENQETAARYDVMSIPTMIVFRNGEIATKIIGAMPKKRLVQELERLFPPIARRAGLPTPETRAVVNDFEVDFWFPELGLVVEADSLTYHRTPGKQLQDRLRDQAHLAAGLIPLRFTHWQIARQATYVEMRLQQVATARLRRAA